MTHPTPFVSSEGSPERSRRVETRPSTEFIQSDAAGDVEGLGTNGVGLPKHVAIIMDGNGRWAAKRGLPRVAGHRAGAEAVRNVRRDGMDALKLDEKKHEISEDERKRLEAEVQKMTDETIKDIDAAAYSKEQEILGK